MMLSTRLPEHCQIRASMCADNMSVVDSWVRGQIMDSLTRTLANQLTAVKLKERREAYTTTFQVDLLVFDPDEFYMIVQSEALAMMTRMNRNTMEKA